MSSFLGKFYLDNKEYNLLSYCLHVKKDIQDGSPFQNRIQRLLKLRIESRGTENANISRWGISPTKTVNGKIVFFKRDAMSKLQEVQLKDAYCVRFEEVFDTSTTEPMYIELTITYGILCGSEIENKLIFKEPEDRVTQKKEIVKIYWTYGEDFTPLSDKSRFYTDMNLHVKTKNYEDGESIEIKIRNENSNALTDDEPEIYVSGTVEDNSVIFKNVLIDYKLNLIN